MIGGWDGINELYGFHILFARSCVFERGGGSAFGVLFLWIPASVPPGLRRNDGMGGLGLGDEVCEGVDYWGEVGFEIFVAIE